MTAIAYYINRFLDWCDKLGEESRQYRKNPDNQQSAFCAPPNARKKAVKIVDEVLFGIGKKKKK